MKALPLIFHRNLGEVVQKVHFDCKMTFRGEKIFTGKKVLCIIKNGDTTCPYQIVWFLLLWYLGGVKFLLSLKVIFI